MKLYTLYFAIALCLGLTACMDDHDAPDTSDLLITSSVSVGDVNATIGELKDAFCANITTAKNNAADKSYAFSSERNYHYYTRIEDDIIITGVVAANDVSGNLYQTLLIRNIETDGTDQAIILKIRNTCLYPYFSVGQRIKINLKGLWIGCYSDVAQIGQPYLTSSNNLRLGPMLFELCKTNIELVGKPDSSVPECTPKDYTSEEGEAWLRSSDNKVYKNFPQLATVSGTIDEVQGDAASKPAVGEVTGEDEQIKNINGHFLKTFAPEEIHDPGYAVNRTISLKSNNSNVILRTSTGNNISFTYLPDDVRSYTGILTFSSYDKVWQMQLRSLDDVQPALPSNIEREAELAQ